MSLLSALILPKLEKELIALEPQIASFVVTQLEILGKDLLSWIDSKAKDAALKEPEK